MASIKAFPKRPIGNTDAQDRWLDLIWQLLKSDVYTPTLANTTNVEESTASQLHYMRVGDVVTVSGQVAINPTAAAATELGMSLPIPSNFSADGQLGGVATDQANENVAAIKADATNNRATFSYTATHTTNRTFWFSFTYRIIQ